MEATSTIWKKTLDLLVELDKAIDEQILEYEDQGQDLSRDYPKSCLAKNPHTPENPDERLVGKKELKWHRRQIVRIHNDLKEEEEAHIDEIDIFLNDFLENQNMDLGWMEAEALPALQDRVNYAIETINGILGVPELFLCSTDEPHKAAHALLKTGWENTGRTQLAERLYNNACPPEDPDKEDETHPDW